MSEPDSTTSIAIIPARGGSKRLPRKNILPLGGTPMLVHTLKAAHDSGVFNTLYVSSDDADILALADEAGAEAVQRPPELATDTAHELEACKHIIETQCQHKPDFFCVIYPTAAFLAPEDLSRSHEQLDAEPSADCVMGVSAYDIHPYKAMTRDDNGYCQMMFPEECKMRSQNYPECVASNGTFYWLRTAAFEQNQTYYQTRLKPHIVPKQRAIDIDTEDDYNRAQELFQLRQANGS